MPPIDKTLRSIGQSDATVMLCTVQKKLPGEFGDVGLTPGFHEISNDDWAGGFNEPAQNC